MHPMERAIVEKLKLEPGEEFAFSIKGSGVGLIESGGIGFAFLTATFIDIIGNEKGAVIIADLNGKKGIMHCAIDINDILSIAKLSNISSPLRSIQ